MARIKLSPLISSINGKLGNAVFQGGKSGIILREKVKPRNPRTQSQSLARNRLASVKALWQDLTSAQRDTWISFSTFYKKSTKNNTTKFLSPYELFIQANTIRLQGDLDPLESTTLEIQSVEQINVNVSRDVGDTLKIDVEISPDIVIEWKVVYISKPFKQSAAIAKSEVRFIFIGPNDGARTDITNEYLKLFSTLPNIGDKVLVKVIGIKTDSGWTSKATFIEDIVS